MNRKLKSSLIMIVALLLITGSAWAKSLTKQQKALHKLSNEGIEYNVDNFLIYVDKDNAEIVQTFIDAGMDPNTPNALGDKAVIIAAEKGLDKMLTLLLKNGADPNAADLDGTTALMYSAYYRQKKTTSILVKNKADVNAQNRNQMTPLMYSVLTGDVECMDELLTKDTELSLTNNMSKTALTLARDKGFIEIANFIKSKLDYLNNRQTPEKKQYEIYLKRNGVRN